MVRSSLPCTYRILTLPYDIALQLLRQLGWVHRDVSIGNILRWEGGAKLADLEYEEDRQYPDTSQKSDGK